MAPPRRSHMRRVARPCIALLHATSTCAYAGDLAKLAPVCHGLLAYLQPKRHADLEEHTSAVLVRKSTRSHCFVTRRQTIPNQIKIYIINYKCL